MPRATRVQPSSSCPPLLVMFYPAGQIVFVGFFLLKSQRMTSQFSADRYLGSRPRSFTPYGYRHTHDFEFPLALDFFFSLSILARGPLVRGFPWGFPPMTRSLRGVPPLCSFTPQPFLYLFLHGTLSERPIFVFL